MQGTQDDCFGFEETKRLRNNERNKEIIFSFAASLVGLLSYCSLHQYTSTVHMRIKVFKRMLFFMFEPTGNGNHNLPCAYLPQMQHFYNQTPHLHFHAFKIFLLLFSSTSFLLDFSVIARCSNHFLDVTSPKRVQTNFGY